VKVMWRDPKNKNRLFSPVNPWKSRKNSK
jgi:hypothetical protein